jgi:quinol monooxygenase YgiN
MATNLRTLNTYDSAAATEQHLVHPHLNQMMSAMSDEGLMAQKPNVMKASTVGGYL